MRLKTILIILIILAVLTSCENQISQPNIKTTEPQKQDIQQTKTVETPKQDTVQEPEQKAEEKPQEEIKPQKNLDLSVVGVWRPYQEVIIYDSGASNLIKPVTRRLTIKEDGTWEFGTQGTWEVKNIEEKDWKKWNMPSQGETKKIILNGWNKGIGDGPISEGTAGVDFIWITYRSETLSLGPATIQIKFGH